MGGFAIAMPQRLPACIQHIEESPVEPRACLVAYYAIAMQGEGFAVMREQHVPATMRAHCA